MKTLLILAAATTVLYAGTTYGQTGSATGSAQGTTQGTVQGTTQNEPANPSTDVAGTAQASADANANAEANYKQLVENVRSKGGHVSAKARAAAEAKLDATAKKVDATAAKGEDRVAAKLATEFKTTAQAMLDEKAQSGTSWGQLTIAHTLAANTKLDVTTQQLLSMHADGMGWGQIAAGLGLNLGESVSAVRTEGRVADGTAKADGQVAVIHGQGARAGISAGVGANAGANSNGNGLGATAGAGTDVKVHVK